MAIQLSEDELNTLRQSKALANQTLSDLDKAERAGIDVKIQRDTVTKQLEQIEKLLTVYG